MNKQMQRLLSLVLVLMLLAGMFPVTAKASDVPESVPESAAEWDDGATVSDGDVVVENVDLPVLQVSTAPTIYYGRNQLAKMSEAQKLLYAYDRIVEGVENTEDRIDLDNGPGYLTTNEFKMVWNAYMRDHTGHFWLGNTYSYSISGTKVISVSPSYIMTGSKLENARAAFDAAAKEILSGIRPSMSDYEKELYLHDALAARIYYDEPENAHNAYGALVNGVCVCEGYAEALQYLLQQVNIQSFIITGSSRGEGHAWNAVNIGGKFYHVDLTWDDQDKTLYHAYFNVTDARIQEDHTIETAAYPLPVCNSEDAFYFTGKDTLLTTYTTDSVGALLKTHNGKVHVYIPSGDTNAFLEWYFNNIMDIAKAAGVNGGFQYGYSGLGRELVLEIPELQGHEHVYDGIVTPPTCEDGGYTTHTCTCGDSYEDSYTDALGHDWNDGVVTKEPTEEAEGVRTYTCTRCDDTKTEPIPKLEHVHKYTPKVTEPTCTEKGYTTHTCECGDSYEDSYTDALDHAWDDGVVTKEPTEEAEGVRTYTCTRCNDTKTEPIPKLDHEHKYTPEVTEPTCTEKGYTTHTCTCGDSYEDSYTDALDHAWNDGVVTKEPTEEAEGVRTYTCTRCNDTKTEPIPKLDPEHKNEVVAEGDWNGGNTRWVLTADGTLTLTGTRHIQGSNNPDNYPWRAYKDQVTKIVVAGQITTICNQAFYGMTNVTSVVIGDTVVKIEDEAFRDCTSLSSVAIPDGVTEIGMGAFWGCTSLPTVAFTADSKLEDLGGSAFGNSGITSQTIPAGVKVLPNSTFYECRNLESVTLHEGLEKIEANAFYYCEKIKSLSLPSTLTQINLQAFRQCLGLEHLEVYGLEHWMSYGNNAIAIYFPESDKLSSVTVLGDPETVTGFGNLKNLTNVILPDSVKTIGSDAFSGCISLKTLDWPASITKIDNGAFARTGFTSMTLPDTVTEIGPNAFRDSNLVSFTMGTGVQSIGMNAFYNSVHLTTVDLGNVTSIENEAFYGCSSLSTVIWSNKLESIGQLAFDGCKALKNVTIPASVTGLGYGAFGNIDSIEITFEGDAPDFVSGCFNGSTGTAYYPGDNNTWTEAVMQNCGGTITWTPYGGGHVHSYDSVETPPTCENSGYTTYTCACGKSYVDSYTNALGHDWDDGVVTQEPTVKNEGVRTYTCARCGDTKTESIPKLESGDSGCTGTGHSFDWGTAYQDPTAGADGFIYTECANCGKRVYIPVGNEIHAPEGSPFHDWEWEVLQITNSIRYHAGLDPLTGFDLLQQATDVRAEEISYYFDHYRPDGSDCFTVLDELGIKAYTAGENIAAGHESPIEVMSDWMNSYGHRSNILYESFQQMGVGYYEGGWYWTNWVQMFLGGSKYTGFRLVTPGNTTYEVGTLIDEMGIYALLTNSFYGDVYLPIQSMYCTGYNPNQEGTQTVTVSVLGYTDSFTITLGEEDPCANGHNLGNWEITKEATCTETGVERRDCTNCDYSETRELDKIPHSYDDEVTAPTCTEQGYTTHTCTCGDSYVDSYTDALDHAWNDGVVTKEPTEEVEGVRTYTCTRCNDTKTEPIPKLDHVHKYTPKVTEPTCTDKGYTTHTCTCGDSYVDSYTDPLGHSFGEWEVTTAPTPTEKGVETRKCACGEEETRDVDAVGYQYGDVNGDGVVDSDDAALICYYDAELIDVDDLLLSVGDVTGDGRVDSDDAALICYMDAELMDYSEFPCFKK